MQGIKNKLEDIWKLIEKTEYCWLWRGRLDKDGYGIWWFEGKNVRPHRLILEINNQPVKQSEVSRHLCHVRNCVNPKHIVSGTQKENIEDQLRRGTFARLKYDDSLIKQIREEYRTEKTSTRKLAAKYGVSKSQIYLIINNKSRTIEKDKNG